MWLEAVNTLGLTKAVLLSSERNLEKVTLPGVWMRFQNEPQFFVRWYNYESLFLEAQIFNNEVIFKAKVPIERTVVLGAVTISEVRCKSSDPIQVIEDVISKLELDLTAYLQSRQSESQL